MMTFQRRFYIIPLWGPMENKTIIGVVENFNYRSPESEITPLVLDIDTISSYRNVYLKASDLPSAVAHTESLWQTYFPEYPVEYRFQQDIFYKTFSQHESSRQTLSVFSIIIISCIGLFGLISYILTRKKREIGIRKVLGYRVSQLFFLIAKEFLVLTLVANIIAWPDVHV